MSQNQEPADGEMPEDRLGKFTTKDDEIVITKPGDKEPDKPTRGAGSATVKPLGEG